MDNVSFLVPPQKGLVDTQVYLNSSAFEMQFRFSFLYVKDSYC